MIIDNTAFEIGLIAIPNLLDDAITQVMVDDAIERHEPIFLEALLGYDLANDLALYAENIIVANPIFDNILDGCVFKVNGINFKYGGLKQAIAHYVWFQFKSETNTTNGDNGELLMRSENATVISPAARMCRVWNEMADSNIRLYQMLSFNALDYQAYSPIKVDCNLISKINDFGI